MITPSSFWPFFFLAAASILYCVLFVRWTVVVVCFGGLPDGVRWTAAVVPGLLSLTELRFYARVRRGQPPSSRLALCRRIASVLLPLSNRRLLCAEWGGCEAA